MGCFFVLSNKNGRHYLQSTDDMLSILNNACAKNNNVLEEKIMELSQYLKSLRDEEKLTQE